MDVPKSDDSYQLTPSRISNIKTLEELNAFRENIGTNRSPEMNRLRETEAWGELIDAIITKLSEFGIECSREEAILFETLEGDTFTSTRIRAIRLKLTEVASLEKLDAEQRGVIAALTARSDQFNDIENREFELLAQAIEGRRAALEASLGQ
ncbi:MAG: hypothetical protein ABII07_06250 [Patescibacteria group bacterium]|nr:hypothetical protein [Candidatus Omnitrophota bacterium]